MAKEAPVSQVTFAGGEISPALRARSDLAKHSTALRFCENMVVIPEGGVTRRPGTMFLSALKDPTQAGLLIPFRFAVGDVGMLVFNAGVMRMFVGAGVVLSAGVPFELAIPYAAADLPKVRFAQIGNKIFLACAGKQPQVLTRTGSNTSWTIGAYLSTGGPVDVQNLDQTVTILWSAVTGNINLAGVNTTWDAGLVGGVFRLGLANLNNIPIWVGNDTSIVVNQERQFNGNVYICTAVSGGSTGPTPPTHLDGVITYQNPGVGSISWKFLYPGYGFVRITAVINPINATATVVTPAGTTTWQLPDVAASYRWSPPAWSADAGWPDRVMVYKQQLLWMRGNIGWITTGVSLFDFDLTSPLATPAIAFRMFADDGSLIKSEWIAQSGGLIIVGGHDGEFQVRGAAPFDALTPANVGAFPSDTAKGSCAHIPARIDGGVAFLSRDRKRLYHMLFSPLIQKTEMRDLTMFARHLLTGAGARVAWQPDPHGIAWVCCQDGSLVSMTFNAEQNLIGCARHPMTGFVEDIGAVQSVDDITTQLYLIVRRVINGVTTRYVELLSSYFPIDTAPPDASGAWYLDCAGQYVGVPATLIGGLGFLAGQVVYAHADGAMQGPFTVNNAGQITLLQAASNVVIGIAIPWRARSLSFDLAQPSTKGIKKEANQVSVDMVNSAGGTIAVNPDEYAQWDDMELTGGANYGAPVLLFSGVRRFSVQSAANEECVVELKAADTMPFTLLGMTPYLIVDEDPS